LESIQRFILLVLWIKQRKRKAKHLRNLLPFLWTVLTSTSALSKNFLAWSDTGNFSCRNYLGRVVALNGTVIVDDTLLDDSSVVMRV
jgi:hypothetical protein